MVSNLALEVFGTGSLHGLSAAKFTQDPAVWLMRSGGKVRALPTSMLSPLLFQALSSSGGNIQLPGAGTRWVLAGLLATGLSGDALQQLGPPGCQ